MAHSLPSLPYDFSALEPVIDATTMQIHHGKHHQTYVDKLNAAVKGTEWENKSLEETLSSLSDLPENIRGAVRNNGGGHYNHSLFWENLQSPSDETNIPQALADKINSDLGGLEAFKEKFAAAAVGQFGSGWAWLYLSADGKLQVASTANQDVPFYPKELGGFGAGSKPLLGLDVWEHAYYLKYQNKRPDYIAAWWKVVNWQKVAGRL